MDSNPDRDLGMRALKLYPEQDHDVTVRVLSPKTPEELEAELKSAHAMIGRLMLLIFDRTDMDADEVMRAIREDGS